MKMKTKKHNRPDVRRRIEKANENKLAREARTDSQQIEHLNSILGKDIGAVKERARLAKETK